MAFIAPIMLAFILLYAGSALADDDVRYQCETSLALDPRLAGQVPCDLRTDKIFMKESENVTAKQDAFWTYTKDVLEKKFHVAGFIEMVAPERKTNIYKYDDGAIVFAAAGCD